MSPAEAHRRTLFRMARLAADRGDHVEARRLDMRIFELAREEAAEIAPAKAELRRRIARRRAR